MTVTPITPTRLMGCAMENIPAVWKGEVYQPLYLSLYSTPPSHPLSISLLPPPSPSLSQNFISIIPQSSLPPLLTIPILPPTSPPFSPPADIQHITCLAFKMGKKDRSHLWYPSPSFLSYLSPPNVPTHIPCLALRMGKGSPSFQKKYRNTNHMTMAKNRTIRRRCTAGKPRERRGELYDCSTNQSYIQTQPWFICCLPSYLFTSTPHPFSLLLSIFFPLSSPPFSHTHTWFQLVKAYTV